VNYVNYGSFEGYDESGQPTTSFTGEIALSTGYTIFYTTIHIGANAKLISSTLENYNSLGGAIILERNDVNWGVSNQEYRDSIYNLGGT
jgi:hypothetical protein